MLSLYFTGSKGPGISSSPSTRSSACEQTCGLNFGMLDSRRALVGTPGTKPQAHVLWLGPPAPNHRRTCFGWDPRRQTTGARALVGTPGTKGAGIRSK